MASDLGFVEYVCDQIGGAGQVTFRQMFGEYAIYCGGKVVALVCGDRLFVKQTPGGLAFIGDAVEARPYPSAKPHFLIEDKLDDREWMTGLIQVTERELSPPKRKTSKSIIR